MAKKIVRGITDVKEINEQDFDTNNVNDLLSDGEHNYIHRKKKDKSEEYHNLTNNLKTIKSTNTDLLKVTNYNNTTNSATLDPQHDKLKEQVIESERNTLDIDYGENGTEETTKVDTNPQKVLEHSNLTSGHGINVNHNEGEETSEIALASDFNENNVGSLTFHNGAQPTTTPFTVEIDRRGKYGVDISVDTEPLNTKLNNKQDKLTAGIDIEIANSTINSTAVTQTNLQIDFTNNMNVLTDYEFTKLEFGAGKTGSKKPAIGHISMMAGALDVSKYGALQGTLAPILNTLLTNHYDSITLTMSSSDLSDLTQVITVVLTTANVNQILGLLGGWFNTTSPSDLLITGTGYKNM